MEIFNHPFCEQELGAPADMQDGSCDSLACTTYSDQYGDWTVSFWKPTAEELNILNEGGCVQLFVRATGDQHPVVALGAFPSC